MDYVIFHELTARFTEISYLFDWLRNAQTCLQCVCVCVCGGGMCVYTYMYIQGVSRLVDITAGGDFLGLCDQKSSYKHVSEFGR